MRLEENRMDDGREVSVRTPVDYDVEYVEEIEVVV